MDRDCHAGRWFDGFFPSPPSRASREVGNLRRSIVALLAAVIVAACSGNDVVEPVPAIEIGLSPGTLSVTQGETSTLNLSLTRSGGFTGDVSIVIEGMPSGILTTVAPPSLDPAVSSAVITLRSSSVAAPGVYNVTVRATGTGVMAATAGLQVTVVAASSFGP